jgi:hypothetical protein
MAVPEGKEDLTTYRRTLWAGDTADPKPCPMLQGYPRETALVVPNELY